MNLLFTSRSWKIGRS